MYETDAQVLLQTKFEVILIGAVQGPVRKENVWIILTEAQL